MVSGMYLGELVRNILLHFIDLNILFGGYSSEILNTHYGFDASFVSKVEGTTSEKEVEKIIVAELKVSSDKISDKCSKLVMWACKMVANRACALAACAIGAVILHTGNNTTPDGEQDTGVDVGVDGRYANLTDMSEDCLSFSVAEFLPEFEGRVRIALKEILGAEGEKRVRIGLAKDGSGVGGPSILVFGESGADALSCSVCTTSQESNGQAQRRKADRHGKAKPHWADGQRAHQTLIACVTCMRVNGRAEESVASMHLAIICSVHMQSAA